MKTFEDIFDIDNRAGLLSGELIGTNGRVVKTDNEIMYVGTHPNYLMTYKQHETIVISSQNCLNEYLKALKILNLKKIYVEKELTLDIGEDLDFQGIEIIYKYQVNIRAYRSHKIKNLTLTKDPKSLIEWIGLDIVGHKNKPLIFENCKITCKAITINYLPFPIRKRTNISTELIRFDVYDSYVGEEDLFKLEVTKTFKSVDDIIGKWFNGKIFGETINFVTDHHHFLITKQGNKYIKVET